MSNLDRCKGKLKTVESQIRVEDYKQSLDQLNVEINATEQEVKQERRCKVTKTAVKVGAATLTGLFLGL